MLKIAVAKGRLMDSFIDILEKAGYDCQGLREETRKLVVDSLDGRLRFILAKPADVPTYVEYGAADLGVVGKDTLVEADKDVAELVDLKYARCRMIVAVPKDLGINKVTDMDFNSRVASKYPRIAFDYFYGQGIQAEVIPLHGSIELGPLIGLSDAIVDITETGRTLVENGLQPIATIMESSARLIANKVSYRIKAAEIREMTAAIEEVIE